MERLRFAYGKLESGRDALLALLNGIDDAEARWRPRPGAWSAVEIANHLADEEREDFRARLRRTLEEPGAAWERIDPEGWVASRAYADRDIRTSIDRFATEREESLRWLAGLENPDWTLTHVHPTAGPIRAGDLLASWVAHDLFHVRQLVRLEYRYLAESLPSFDPSYAGDWGEP